MTQEEDRYIDLKRKRPPAVQMMQYNVQQILNSKIFEEDSERIKKSSHPPPKTPANPDDIMLPLPDTFEYSKLETVNEMKKNYSHI